MMIMNMFYAQVNLIRINIIRQGGPNIFFPLAKSICPVGPKGQEIPPDTIFEN
jgi:hypothetical protein